MKTMKVDRIAAGHLLDTFTDTTPEMLAALTMPTLVVCGEQDQDNGSAEELVAALPDARPATIPGTHMSSVTEPERGEAIARSEEHTSDLQALMRISYAVFCMKNKNKIPTVSNR